MFTRIRLITRPFMLSLVTIILLAPLLGGCASMMVGGAATVGIAAYQERGLEQAARDTKHAAEIRAKYITNNADLAAQVGIEVYEARALLTGLVETEALRAEAVRTAWEVEELKDVINEIQLRSDQGFVEFAYDSWITTQLQTKMTFDEDILAINYALETVNGVIYLIGIAASPAEHDMVLSYARDIDRVRKVISHVRIMEAQ